MDTSKGEETVSQCAVEASHLSRSSMEREAEVVRNND